MTVTDPITVLQELGRGTEPERLGIRRLESGLLDLRQLRLPRPQALATARINGALAQYAPGRPVVSGGELSKVDLTGSDLTGLIWETPYTLKDARLDRVRGRNQTFRAGLLERVTFHGSDLRDSHWGVDGAFGPTLQNVSFADADLRGSTFGHPRFKGCQFVNSRLDGIDFNGGEFEDCTFEGSLREVWFHGRGRGSTPEVTSRLNPMRNVDFTRADLQFVEFLDGVDLTACRFPDKGYIRFRNPKAVFQMVRERVSLWNDKRRDKALKYVGYLVEHHFRQDVPIYVMRPEDLSEHSQLKGGVGARILEELEVVLREQKVRT